MAPPAVAPKGLRVAACWTRRTRQSPSSILQGHGEVQRGTGQTGDRALSGTGYYSSLRVKLVDLDMSPYVDFALFVGFQHRFAMSLKFKSHILQPDGSFRTVEVP